MALPLIQILDQAYHLVADNLPAGLQQYEKSIAVVCGFVGAGAIVWSLQALSKHVVDRFVPYFHEKILPKCEAACIPLTIAAPFAYAVIDPKTAKTVSEHPVYLSGVLTAMGTAVATASIDLYLRHRASKQELLEDKIQKRKIRKQRDVDFFN